MGGDLALSGKIQRYSHKDSPLYDGGNHGHHLYRWQSQFVVPDGQGGIDMNMSDWQTVIEAIDRIKGVCVRLNVRSIPQHDEDLKQIDPVVEDDGRVRQPVSYFGIALIGRRDGSVSPEEAARGLPLIVTCLCSECGHRKSTVPTKRVLTARQEDDHPHDVEMPFSAGSAVTGLEGVHAESPQQQHTAYHGLIIPMWLGSDIAVIVRNTGARIAAMTRRLWRMLRHLAHLPYRRSSGSNSLPA